MGMLKCIFSTFEPWLICSQFIGGMRNSRDLRFGFKAPMLKGMSVMQSLLALKQLPMPYLSTIGKALVAMLNLVCLALGIVYAEPVVDIRNQHVVRLVYAYMFHKLATFVFETHGALVWGHNIRRRAVVCTWQGIHLAKSGVCDHLPSWLVGASLGFVSTGSKSGSPALNLNERDARHRPSTGIRLNIVQQTEGVLWHGVYFVVVMILTVWNVHHIIWASRTWSIAFLWLVSGPLFPGMKLEIIFCHLSPIWYLVKPPTMPHDRLELMEPDERTGGNRPKSEHRGVRFTKSMWMWELLNIASILWSLSAFWIMNDGFGVFVTKASNSTESDQLSLATEYVVKALIVLVLLITMGSFWGGAWTLGRLAARRDEEDIPLLQREIVEKEE